MGCGSAAILEFRADTYRIGATLEVESAGRASGPIEAPDVLGDAGRGAGSDPD